MTDEQIERLVTNILHRLQPPVLVMVTDAEGYRQQICRRLATSGQRMQLALDDTIADSAQWQKTGEVLPAHVWHKALPSEPYRALLLPFLDYPLAAQLVNGNLQSPVAQRLHDALLAGIPVLALRYHCDPESELNQLCGVKANSAYAAKIQSTLSQLAAAGVTLCTMNELLNILASDQPEATPVGFPRRYLTVTDVEMNPSLATTPDALLTDAAKDFLNERKI
ncbi:hypothetical protein [Erwinia sorbitola]|uniref:Uncharacterized protein n=1 Tax=Erwinia sorbitola TaxID=2681984 RepID=A0A6I6EU01_9GAMM|nr:hypothetical protein [Erwinia sorbitola]QGU88559.1 hypothetical protein GN242_15620 [Erwinia sorbitola]